MRSTELFRQAGMMLALAAQTGNLTDNQALAVKGLYKVWKSGESVEVGDLRQYNDLLYKCRQADTTQADWTPDVYAAGWEVVDFDHAGTKEDPIPWAVNMTAYSGKYYTYDGVLYECIRDSEIPLNYTPDQLIDTYFREVSAGERG